MRKPFRNFREGFFVFGPKIRIFWKSIFLTHGNRFLSFSHFFLLNQNFFKPVLKILT
jgi:hypothetical protein